MTQHGLERDFGYMNIQGGMKKVPPAPMPKPKTHNSAPQPYRPNPGMYKAMYAAADDDFPPPPPPQEHSYPPPPPSDPARSYGYHGQSDEYLPPPPPTSSYEYSQQSHSQSSHPVSVRTVQTSYGSPASSLDRGGDFSVSQDSSNYVNQPNYPTSGEQSNYANVSHTATYSTSPSSSNQNYMYARPDAARQSAAAYSPQPQPPQFEPRPVDLHSKTISHEPTRTSGQSPSVKEAEVDALTSLLLQNMEASADPDFYGVCAMCDKKVIGESNGCTALDQIYHISCFTCVNCDKLLRGSSFYKLETKPYCEPCYMNTLEKCTVCSKPITDRLLRATGKPYHADCFTCVICHKSLDGIPFTVDATNQIHCIEDFHKKFAPRCCLCQQAIMPESGQQETVRVVAMDRSFHVNCYRCEDCGLLLSSEAEGRGCYPLDEHILCKNCNAKRIQAMTTKMTTEL